MSYNLLNWAPIIGNSDWAFQELLKLGHQSPMKNLPRAGSPLRTKLPSHAPYSFQESLHLGRPFCVIQPVFCCHASWTFYFLTIVFFGSGTYVRKHWSVSCNMKYLRTTFVLNADTPGTVWDAFLKYLPYAIDPWTTRGWDHWPLCSQKPRYSFRFCKILTTNSPPEP